MRPKTPDSDRLEAGIHIRLTALEKKLLSDRSKREGYLTLSDFGRAKLLKKREIRKIEVSMEFVTIVCKTDFELVFRQCQYADEKSISFWSEPQVEDS